MRGGEGIGLGDGDAAAVGGGGGACGCEVGYGGFAGDVEESDEFCVCGCVDAVVGD